MKRYYMRLCSLMLVIILFAGCREEFDTAPSSDTADGTATVRLKVATKPYAKVSTRSGSAMESTQIDDLTILQFRKHRLVQKETFSQGFDPANITLTLKSMQSTGLTGGGYVDPEGNGNVIVFLANFESDFPEVLTAMNMNARPSYTALTAMLADATALGALGTMPMVGHYYDALEAGSSPTINVELVRALAKINFTVDTSNFTVDGLAPTSIKVNAIELRNVPKTITFSPSSATYPEASGAGEPAIGTDAANYMVLDSIHNLADDKLTNFIAYMPANARGKYTQIGANKDKYPQFIDPAPQGWTYIYVDVTYMLPTLYGANVTYKIYLGSNATDDINIEAGYQYNITTKLMGVNASENIITRVEEINPTLFVEDNANCYIVNENTTKDNTLTLSMNQAIKGWEWMEANGDVGTSENTDALKTLLADTDNWKVELLWCTWSNFDANSNGFVIGSRVAGMMTDTNKNEERTDWIVQLTGLDKAPAGHNAVIALKDTKNEDIWWTWHLWFTDYAPTATGATNGEVHTYISDAFKENGLYRNKVMMDRNLGATGSGSLMGQPEMDNAPNWYGMMYQWGRKDPFTPNASGSNTIGEAVKIFNDKGDPIKDGIYPGDLGGLTPDAANSVDGFPKVSAGTVNNLIAATRMPYIYFYNSASPYDWTVQNDNLWGGTTTVATVDKTPFDPCPAGWRVPSAENEKVNPWAGFADNSGGSIGSTGAGANIFTWWGQNGTTSTSSNTGVRAGRLYDKDGIRAWYPASGRRNSYTGAFNYVGSAGYSWSAAIPSGSANAYYLNFGATSVHPQGNYGRANGSPVRCVQE